MENQITCAKCGRTIMNNPLIDAAAKGEDHSLGSQYVICECGERNLVLDDHGPTERSKKNSCKIPEMVSQPLQWLMP